MAIAESTWIERLDLSTRKNVRIYGALRRCSKSDWWKASTELFITLLFALFSVWLPLLVLPMFGVDNKGIMDTLYEQISNGELYIITTALLAPVFYFTFPSARVGLNSESRHFPSQQIIILVFIGTIIVAVLAIAATKVQAAHLILRSDSTAQGATTAGIPARMITWSVWLFSFTTILYFLSLAVKNWLERGGVDEVLDEQSRAQDKENPVPLDPEEENAPPRPSTDDWIKSTIDEHAVTNDAA